MTLRMLARTIRAAWGLGEADSEFRFVIEQTSYSSSKRKLAAAANGVAAAAPRRTTAAEGRSSDRNGRSGEPASQLRHQIAIADRTLRPLRPRQHLPDHRARSRRIFTASECYRDPAERSTREYRHHGA